VIFSVALKIYDINLATYDAGLNMVQRKNEILSVDRIWGDWGLCVFPGVGGQIVWG
jgi:hypothetical protein